MVKRRNKEVRPYLGDSLHEEDVFDARIRLFEEYRPRSGRGLRLFGRITLIAIITGAVVGWLSVFFSTKAFPAEIFVPVPTECSALAAKHGVAQTLTSTWQVRWALLKLKMLRGSDPEIVTCKAVAASMYAAWKASNSTR